MKILRNDAIIWWRAAMTAGSIALAVAAFFSFFLYQRVAILANQSVLPEGEERPALFSPALLDDMKVFWQKRVEEFGE